MRSLEKSLRNELARTVLAARELAEDAARKALHTLGVDEPDAPGHLDNDGRLLRRKLRAQARQLGDKEDTQKKGRYRIDHLVEKIAYDHWHRLLFARFLAENDLLISPDHGVGVSLADCEELAPELGFKDGWEVAAAFAARMLPQIFRDDDPAGSVTYAPEDRVALRQMVTSQPRDMFMADDALGWVYQFWQAQRKEDVNKSGNKIGADEISPVTQLFTEDYMVLFLLHNTLGAWWAGRHLDKLEGCTSEDECREAVALPGVEWEYLRCIQDEESGSWKPAAGSFEGWPKTAAELRVMDPSMGSGHFLVFELPILVAMRMTEEGSCTVDAVTNVLRDNLFGLEIDPRCTQIAAFNLALAAWKLVGQYSQLPELNLACCGLGINAARSEWLSLAPGEGFLMGQFYDLFKDAPILGSLIDPARNIKTVHGVPIIGKVEEAVFQGLEKFRANKDFDHEELGVTAQGVAGAYHLLTGQFDLVATNVPFLGYREMDTQLLEHVATHFPSEKGDLGYCLWRRFHGFVGSGRTTALVSLQHWLSLRSYTGMREALLSAFAVQVVAHLGTRAFETISGEKVNVTLTIATKSSAPMASEMQLIDAAPGRKPSEKASDLMKVSSRATSQEKQYENPDHRISFGALTELPRLSQYAECLAGIMNGDSPKFIRQFWEFAAKDELWAFLQSTVSPGTSIGGLESVILFDETNGHLREDASVRRIKLHNADERGNSVWGRSGVAISQMSSLPASRYFGNKYDSNVATIVPRKSEHLAAIWAFCSSDLFHDTVRAIDRKLNVTNATFGKVPFDLAHWQKVAAEKYPNGLPKPHSNDPAQWLFSGHPRDSDAPLQVAVERLLGYRWPRQTGSEFPDCPALDPDGLERHADGDGIVCISAIKGEQQAAERLRVLLAAAYSAEWSAKTQAELLVGVGYGGRTLEDWLRDGFLEQHCQRFHQRPFIWHIWDGLKDGFSALVNYHRLNRANLEKLTYTYLGDWIARQKAAVSSGEEGSDAKLAAAQALQESLKKILEGEAPYDIFVRWKPLKKQPIGWEPDLNDGVRLNIRPFMSVPDVGRKGAGILRYAPKIHWKKDRGKDVSSAPWYKVFEGDRINDHHLTLAEKRAARGE